MFLRKSVNKIACALCIALMVPSMTSAERLTLDVCTSGVTKPAAIGYDWEDEWLDHSSYEYNHGMARISGAIMSSVYLQTKYEGLTNLLTQFGCERGTIEDHNYAFVEKGNPDKTGYTFAIKDAGGRKLVIVALRGTTGRQEWLSNLNISNTTKQRERYHEGFWNAAKLAAFDLAAYMKKWQVPSDARVLVTGHSRGAAVADLLGAILTSGGNMRMIRHDTKAADIDVPAFSLKPSHVYVYTFATPTTCTDQEVRLAAAYRNIINIINPEDIVPQVPFRGGSWSYGTIGRNYILPSADRLSGDKERYNALLENMRKPFAALTDGKVYEPVHHSEELARSVKNMQWAIGSVEHFYKSSGRLGWKRIVDMASNMPVEDDDGIEEEYTGGTAVFITKHPKKSAGLLYMHATQTYNAWLLSGSPSEIYMPNNPSLIKVRMKDAPVSLLDDTLKFNISVRVTGGETLGSIKAGMLSLRTEDGSPDGRRVNDAELTAVGDGEAHFTVPEGESSEVTIESPSCDMDIILTSEIEANANNGLKQGELTSSLDVHLTKGKPQTFICANRELHPAG